MKRKIVIHNYLPAHRVRDAEPRFTKENLRLSEELVRKAEEALAAAPMGMQKAARRKELDKAKQHLDRVKKDVAVNGTKDADDLQRYAGDVIWTDVSEAEYNKLSPGDTIQVEGMAAVVIEKDQVASKIGRSTKNRVKVRFKSHGKDGSARREGNQLIHPRAVSRDDEEKNRSASYRKTGIKRVDPEHERWKQQQAEEQNARGGSFHDKRRRA